MSSSAINQSVFQAKIGSVQNDADSSAVYSAGVWSFKNSTAVTGVTITNAGNVGIGTASPTSKLHVNAGGNYGMLTMQAVNGSDIAFTSGATTISSIAVDSTAGANPTMIFRNGGTNTERMRIDASGNLLVGLTSFATHIIRRDTSLEEGTLRVQNAGTTDTSPALGIQKTGSSGDSTANKVVNFLRGPAAAGAIVFNGAGGVTFGSYSDERLKENFQPLEPQLDKLLKVEVMRFDFKEGSKNCIGTTAQKMKNIYPECVSEADDEMKTLSISDWSITEYKLLKAIQEQQAIIDALEARLAALEAKP